MAQNENETGKLPQEPRQFKPGAALLLMLIRSYQLSLSSLVGRHCRHLPSCSDYAAEAIRRHGAWRGFLLGLFRVLRCNPLGTSGYDPVPEIVPKSPFALSELWRMGKNRHD
ncbi:MAG TPA: membrane protein insertion efficiency factor YidD [Aestuariivirgaceae bacterium]|jgi:putative membrane protein insertion efficiency factor